jgi:hypothetical protein
MTPRASHYAEWIKKNYACIGHVEHFDVMTRVRRSGEEWDVVLLDATHGTLDLRFDLYLSKNSETRWNQKKFAERVISETGDDVLIRILAMVRCFAPHLNKGEQNRKLVRILNPKEGKQ